MRAARVAVVLWGLAVLLAPQPAGAHAAIVSSDPEAGAELSATPGVVVLRFTEPLNTGLSRATVTDPSGQPFEASTPAEREIRVPLSTNVPGVYEVEWTTVSTVDGHTLRGSFRFGVGVSPGPGAEGTVGVTPQGSDLLIAVARTVEYAGLLLAVGVLLMRRLSRRPPELPWANRSVTVWLTVALVGGLAVVGGEALAAAPSPSTGAVIGYVTSGLPGTARLVRLAAEALALLAALRRVGAAAPLLGVALVALAAAGHAAATRPTWAGITVDAIHLVSAGLWAGGIVALAMLRPPAGWRGPEGRRLLDRFSPVAVSAFLLTVGAGVVRGWQELNAPVELFTTSYGLVLTAKVAGVLAMVPLSVLAWRRIRSPRLEAALAVGVIAAAALLASYPLPPGRAGEADEARRPGGATAALPRHGDLTLGGEAGSTLVALTLRPGTPGRNQAFVYVLPLEGEEEAAGVLVRISTGGEPMPMRECGPTCRSAPIPLRSKDTVRVAVGGSGGGTATFNLPGLPAADGSGLLDRMDRRMNALRSYHLAEVLRPVDPPFRARYVFEAPDRMHVRAATGSESLFFEDTRYRREGPGRMWSASPAPPLNVPTFIWEVGKRFVASKVLGTDRVGGVHTTVVSFFGGSGVPIWFRLWIDDEGLVRGAEMRAQGHFMDHRYFGFDAPVDIDPPPPSRVRAEDDA